MRLYIFGNGFDRAHNLPTSYCQFRKWLINKYNVNVDEEIELPNYQTNYKRLEDYDDKQFAGFFVRLIDDADSNSENEDKWCCFEEDLAKLRWELSLHNEDKVYDKEGRLDYSQTDNNLSIRAQTCGESNHILRSFFQKWIIHINNIISKRYCKAKKRFFKKALHKRSKYLTFNYTNTLEVLYNIKNVCHIHGDISKWEEPIFGHGDPGYTNKEHESYEDNAYDIFRKIYERYIKDTKKQIERHSKFFDSIKNVDEVYLYGLSLGDVDLPYFSYIFKNCQNIKRVYLYVYDPNEFADKSAKLKSCGVKCKIYQWRLKKI